MNRYILQQRVDDIVTALNAYDAAGEDTARLAGFVGEIWADVIVDLPEYDAVLTDAVDAGDSARLVLVDGTEIRWNGERAGSWAVRGRTYTAEVGVTYAEFLADTADGTRPLFVDLGAGVVRIDDLRAAYELSEAEDGVVSREDDGWFLSVDGEGYPVRQAP